MKYTYKVVFKVQGNLVVRQEVDRKNKGDYRIYPVNLLDEVLVKADFMDIYEDKVLFYKNNKGGIAIITAIFKYKDIKFIALLQKKEGKL